MNKIIIICHHKIIIVIIMDTCLDKLGINIRMGLLQKTAWLGTARILEKGVGKVILWLLDYGTLASLV